MRSRSGQIPWACALLSMLAPGAGPVAAAGFYIQEQSVRGIGRANAGAAAAADDASTIFFNPAGLTRLTRPELLVGGHLLLPRAQLENHGSTVVSPGSAGLPVPTGGNDGGNPFKATIVPNFYLAWPLVEDRLVAGLGVSSHFGLSTDYPEDWFGRYDSTYSDLRVIDIAPSIGVRVTPWLSLGGAFDIQYIDARLENALPDPTAPGGPSPASDGRFRIKGDDWGLGFNLGLLLEPRPTTRIGLHYRSSVSHDLDGTARFSGLAGPLAPLNRSTGGRAAIELPEIASLAMAQEVMPRLTLLANVSWFGWGRLEELRIDLADDATDLVRPLDYDNSWQVALGAEYALTERWTLRGGVQFDQTPTNGAHRDTRVPDGDRYWLALGASWQVGQRLALDLAYAHVFSSDVRIDREQDFYGSSALASTTRSRASVDGDLDVIGIQFRAAF
jgi:long-chain fatty acid transport protein